LDASDTTGASVNIKRVGNQGAGSIDEAYEAVAIRRIIDDPASPLKITTDSIDEFGAKINTADLGVGRATIEADCLLKDGTFIDMKHSALNDPFIDRGQLNAVAAALQRKRIKSAVYVVSSELDAATLGKIADANAALDIAMNRAAGSPPLITRIIKGPPLQ
jgi:hypothetical protein